MNHEPNVFVSSSQKKKKKNICFIKCKANYINTSGDLGHLQTQNISVNFE